MHRNCEWNVRSWAMSHMNMGGGQRIPEISENACKITNVVENRRGNKKKLYPSSKRHKISLAGSGYTIMIN